MYSVSIKKEALKELKSLPAKTILAISKAIDKLAENPRPVGSLKLKGTSDNLYRIRIGDYRVVYLVNDTIRIVNIRHIGNRKDIYDR